MSDKSTIEWTDATWNPVRGCIKVSQGCKHCYAETFAERFRGVPGHAYERGFDPRLAPEQLEVPLHWRSSRMVFVNSMSDLFGDFVPDGYVLDVFRIVATANQHTYQVLTKRAERLSEWFAKWTDVDEENPEPVMARGPAAVRAAHKARRARLFADMIERWGEPPGGAAYPSYDWMGGMRWWPNVFPNVWLGVSVEDRKYGLPRIEQLRRTPAVVRFLSIEPLLEDLGELDLTGIHWVIVGGESGRGARPMHPAWARSIRDQCGAAGVPFYFKQWGCWLPRSQQPGVAERGVVDDKYPGLPKNGYPENRVHRWTDGEESYRLTKQHGGRLLDGRTWDEMPAGYKSPVRSSGERSLPVVQP